MTPWVQRLVIANVIVFFLQQTVPGGLMQFGFQPHFILQQPWTLITYMFLHGGFGHILFNMIGLYFFGGRVEERLGPERFFALYFLSGIAGALMTFVFDDRGLVIGASGAVLGVMLAFARFWPRYQIYIWGIVPVEARWLVLGYTAMDLLGGFTPSVGGGTAHFAHLGGFVGAFLYLLFVERQVGAGARQFKKQVNAAPPVDALAGGWQKVDRNAVHAVNKDEVNRILDKISASGIKSLTPQERIFLSNFVPLDDRKPIPPS